jgi:CHAT domain-containing protein/Tfp pilus assembly protein PilF
MVLLLAFPGVAGETSPRPAPLMPGTPIERPLQAEVPSLFEVDLTAATPWRLQVEQLGIDVVVEVQSSQGQSLLTIDTPQGREGTESLVLPPTVSGRYSVEVRCESPGVPDGHFRIRLDALPTATPAERQRLRAEEAVTEAGRLYRQGEDGALEKAVASLRVALDLWRSLGDRHQEARTGFLLGTFWEALEDPRQAVAAYQEALAGWRQLNDPRGKAAVLDRLGFAHLSLGENTVALPHLEAALALRQSLGQRGQEAETRNRCCLALQKMGRFPAASACYEAALTLAREVGDRPLEATVLNNLGGIYANLGEPEKQARYLQQALALRREVGDALGEAITLNNLGAFHRGLGEVEAALLDYAPALALFERLDNRYWQARTLNNIGYAYLSLGDLERARAYLLRALPLRRAVGDGAGETVTLLNLGRTAAALGEGVKALAFYRRALDNNLAAGNQRGATTARQLLGELHLERGEPTAAREALELARAELHQRGQRRQEAEVLGLLARVSLLQAERDPDALSKARDLAARALTLHRAVRNPVGEVTVLATLARIDRHRGRPESAGDTLRAALETLETLQGRLGDPNQKAAFLATQREVVGLHIDLLMERHHQHPDQGHDRAALEASERARSRSLLAMLEGAGAGLDAAGDPALAERLRAAERRFTAQTRRRIEQPEALAVEQDFYRALTDLDNARAALRRQSPRYAALRQPQTLDTRAIQALLDPDTVLLEFFLGGERSFLWWVTPTAVDTFELPPAPVVEELARQVHRRFSGIHQRTSADREALAALGRMLLGPVADRLQGQRLVIVADGALHAVPFAALPLPEIGEPLLVHHEVVHLPSASVLAAQRREFVPRPGTTKTVAILADPLFDRRDPRIAPTSAGSEALDRLPHTRREAEAIAALVPAERRLLALDGAARRSRVVDGELNDYRILHFATHGFVNPRTPELSGLMLSRVNTDGEAVDGFLGLHAVANLELSAELVVLSGCQTALGKAMRGEGWVGLTRGFLYAGVPRVVASLWQVRDEATATLMAHFYRAMLVDGERPAAALRAAQLSLRQERRFRDPFYWAAFGLQGDWR